MNKRKWVIVNQNKYVILLHNIKDLPQYDKFTEVPKSVIKQIKNQKQGEEDKEE